MPTKQSKSRPKDKTFLVVGPLFFRSSLLSLSRERFWSSPTPSVGASLTFPPFGSFRSRRGRPSRSSWLWWHSALSSLTFLDFFYPGRRLASSYFLPPGRHKKYERKKEKKNRRPEEGLFLSSSSPFLSTQGTTTPRDARRRQSSSWSSSSRSVVAQWRFFFFVRQSGFFERLTTFAHLKKAMICVCIDTCLKTVGRGLPSFEKKE